MTTKYLKQASGQITEVATVSTSAGAGDADKVPSLNAGGILDPTIVNGTVTSAGAGDSGKVVQLDAGGKIDTTALPTGVGAETKIITASEALSAGDWINVHNSTGAKARKADASNGRKAHGFVLAGVSNGNPATVYFEGTNNQQSSRTPGATQYLSGSTPGASTETAPSTSTYIVQEIGVAESATEVSFEPQPTITLV